MKSIIETARMTTGLMMMVDAIERAGLTDTFERSGPYTLFAPTDGAFERLPKDIFDQLQGDMQTLRQVLLYHAVEGKLMLEDIVSMQQLMALNKTELTVGESIYGPLINDSKILTPDIECSNGVIHVVNYVLFPGLVRVKGGVQY